ncbi:MAG TPA: DinB family protein [Armatimonadota bacterium]|nr:DinB family protein [Armatimonadota bacterium]
MIRMLADFVKEWTIESRSTLNLINHLTDASLGQRVDADGWTLGKIAWHLATSPCDLMKLAGLPVADVNDDDPVPDNVAEIAATYERVAAALLEQVQQHWTDAMLLDVLNIYGQSWTRGETLSVLFGHQTHHRGQMTVLMRQAGLRVPGVCGPSREEMAEILKANAKSG